MAEFNPDDQIMTPEDEFMNHAEDTADLQSASDDEADSASDTTNPSKTDELVDTAVLTPLNQRSPEVQEILDGDRPTNTSGLQGSGATDTFDPVTLAGQDNTKAF